MYDAEDLNILRFYDSLDEEEKKSDAHKKQWCSIKWKNFRIFFSFRGEGNKNVKLHNKTQTLKQINSLEKNDNKLLNQLKTFLLH